MQLSVPALSPRPPLPQGPSHFSVAVSKLEATGLTDLSHPRGSSPLPSSHTAPSRLPHLFVLLPLLATLMHMP